MNRKLFLTVAAVIALAVGAFALLQPSLLLQGKGVALNPAANVWVRETGIALVAIGTVAFLLRAQPDSPALRAFLIGGAVLQVGLLSIELHAWLDGVITRFSGVAPNSALHIVLACGFAWFAARVQPTQAAGGTQR